MDIHERICGYGCGYGWEISYPRQPWFILVLLRLKLAQIIEGTQEMRAALGYAHDPFCPKCFMGFCSDGPCECPAKFEVRSCISSLSLTNYKHDHSRGLHGYTQ